MRGLLAWLGFVDLVWLRDIDGEVVIRILRHRGPFLCAIRIGPFFWPTRTVALLPNGDVHGACYVRDWGYVENGREPNLGRGMGK